MTTRAELTRTYRTHRLDFAVHDSDERIPEGKRAFRPDYLTLEWSDDGVGWVLTSARLSGQLWKKDNTIGDIRMDRDFGGWRRDLDRAPEWVHGLIAAHAPTGDDQSAITVVVEEPPGPTSQFIEVENDRGDSVRVGEWTTAANGWGRLRITVGDIRKALR